MNAKKKGNAGENKWANWLTKEGVCNAYRNSSSGSNTRKSDVHNDININFEVKTVKKLNLLQAYKQSENDCRQTHATPYVVIHFDGMPEDTWLVVMNNHDWKDLIMKSDLRGEIVVDDSKSLRNIEYQTKFIKDACNKILKEINNE